MLYIRLLQPTRAAFKTVTIAVSGTAVSALYKGV